MKAFELRARASCSTTSWIDSAAAPRSKQPMSARSSSGIGRRRRDKARLLESMPRAAAPDQRKSRAVVGAGIREANAAIHLDLPRVIQAPRHVRFDRARIFAVAYG